MCQGLARVGDFYADRKNYDSALSYYQKSLVALIPSFTSLNVEDNPTLEAIGFFDFAYVVLPKKAAALKGKFNTSKNSTHLAQSLSCLRLAEQVLSKQRGNLDMDKSKWEFLDAEYDLYEDILSRLFEHRKILTEDTVYSLAFRYFENSKSRSLADALAQAEQTERITTKDSLFRVHIELRRELLAAQDKINQELEKRSGSDEIARLREEMVSIDRRIQNCKQAIELKYPGYFNVKYGDATPLLNDVRRVLNDRGQVVLEYLWGSEWVYALCVSPDEIRFERIGRPDSLNVAIKKVVQHFDEKTTGIDADAYNSFVANAHQLYEMLVEPFATLIKQRKRILVIPDGPVNQVPFEVLLSERPAGAAIDYRSLKYLIKEFSIGYAYSSAMLIRQNDKPVRRPSLLAVGFTGGARLRAPDPELEEIIGAEEELEALAKRFKRGKFLVGPEATEANFKSLSSQFDIIHLAIHGRGDVQRSFSSSLYFRTKYDSLDDGELHDYELYGLKLKALMAVLSACESGLGRDYKGEGMLSMASAFTYSGCRNILMSLWKVNDKASINLMDDFYGQLLEGKTIDDALRQAKLSYLESSDELTSDPKIWAPLVAYGGLQPIFQESNDFVIYGVIALLVLFITLFILRKNRTI
jgi:CHAT domain-containing protein